MDNSFSDEDYSKEEQFKKTRQNYDQDYKMPIYDINDIEPSVKVQNEQNFQVFESPFDQAKLSSLQLNSKNKIVIHSTLNLRSCKKERYLVYPQVSEKTIKGRVSDYKNLGKALVKILRRVIDEERFPTTPDTAQTVQNLWAIFKRSIPNITMASAVIGSIQNFSYSSLTKLGFKRVIKKRNSMQIVNAQVIIRKGILDQLQLINIDEQIDKSKVAAKDKFKKYMHARINQMKHGTFKQRISRQIFQNNQQLSDHIYHHQGNKKDQSYKKKSQRLKYEKQLIQQKKQKLKEYILNNSPEQNFIKNEEEIFQQQGIKNQIDQEQNPFDYIDNFMPLKKQISNNNIENHQSGLLQNNQGFLEYSLNVLENKIESPWFFE